jgi:hypothetical protein
MSVLPERLCSCPITFSAWHGRSALSPPTVSKSEVGNWAFTALWTVVYTVCRESAPVKPVPMPEGDGDLKREFRLPACSGKPIVP